MLLSREEGNKSESDDLGYIDTLISHLKTQYNIDEDKIFACGFSNGAFFSYALKWVLHGR